jgi:predicted TIM-barrel fold metal-dependent hydrolase
MTEVGLDPRPAAGEQRPVLLVDADIHPTLTQPELLKRLSARWSRHVERFGRRTQLITELYPRTSNAGMRADSWPDAPGSIPGSELGLVQRQLLDEYEMDYGVLNCLNMLHCFEVPQLAADIARAINDWLWEDWLVPEPRLLGSIVVPSEFPELSVREIERCAGVPRWVQVLLPGTGLEPLGSRKYWPIYEAAAAHGLPVAVHNAGYEPHLGTGWPSYYLEEHVAYSFVMQTQLLNMVCEGLFEAVPSLRVVLTEGGVTWAIALRWGLDSAWELLREEVPHVERRPSELIHEHVWFTTQPIEEPDVPGQFTQALEHGALADRLLFATDYPHWDFDSPTQSLPRSVPKDMRARIMAGTACDLYRLPLESRVG